MAGGASAYSLKLIRPSGLTCPCPLRTLFLPLQTLMRILAAAPYEVGRAGGFS